MPALAGLRRFASSRNGKLALGGTAAGGVVALGLVSRRRNDGDPPALIPYSEVQGTSGVNAGSFPSLEASGVSVGEYEALVNQMGALADRVDSLTPEPTGNPPPTPPSARTLSVGPKTGKLLYTVREGDSWQAIARDFYGTAHNFDDFVRLQQSATASGVTRGGNLVVGGGIYVPETWLNRARLHT